MSLVIRVPVILLRHPRQIGSLSPLSGDVLVVSLLAFPQVVECIEGLLEQVALVPGILLVGARDSPASATKECLERGWCYLEEEASPFFLWSALRAASAGASFVDPYAIGARWRRLARERSVVDAARQPVSGAQDETWGTQTPRRVDRTRALPPHCWGVALLIGLGWGDAQMAVRLGHEEESTNSYRHEVYRICPHISERWDLMVLAQGGPPCGGVLSRCVEPGRPLQALRRDSIPSCPCSPVCVGALGNY